MADGVNLAISGLASGFDWQSFISQIIQAERAPETTLRTHQSNLQQRNNAFGTIKTQLSTLQTAVDALKDASLFDSRTAGSSDLTLATATAASGAAAGSYIFNFSQLATASVVHGTANLAQALSSTSDVSGVTLATAGFPTPVTAGTFTVNGQQVSIGTSDTLQQVFDKIASATSNSVTASYDPVADKINLASSSPIVLGSATDTSNFLQAARLSNNGTGSISSGLALGSIRMDADLAVAGFATAVSDGGAGAGEFKINGVSIAYNASTDSVSTVLDRINNSTAGVTASYDTINDRFLLTSKATGDMGVALQDVTGNFLAATGLSGGALTRGQDLLYTVNGGPQLTSQSNTITDSSSGISGLSVTALKENSPVTITVGNDTSKVKSAIQSFVDAYNQVQSYISSQTASTTDAKGVVSAGLLAGDHQASDLMSSLRASVFSGVAGLDGTVARLADLGYQTNGYDNQIALSDSTQLDTALSSNLSGVKQFFSDATKGLAVTLDTYLTNTVGDSGSIATHQNSLTKQSTDIDTQITNLEKTIQADQKRMTNEFIAMETAQAQINQELTYLTKNFG